MTLADYKIENAVTRHRRQEDSPHRLNQRTGLDQLQRQPVEVFDEHRAGLAERIGALQDGNPGRLQVREHRVEVGVGDRDVVHHLQGSRVGVRLFGERRVFHRPHPGPETDKGAVASIREWLRANGVEP